MPVVVQRHLVQGTQAAHVGNAAARHDAFLHGRAGGVQRIFHPCLLLLHFRLGGRADANHRNAADQFGETLLKLFAVVIRGGFIDLHANLVYPTLDIGGRSGTLYQGGVFLVDGDPLDLAQVVQGDILEFDAQVLGNDVAACQDGYVAQHFLAPIAKARGLHRGALQRTAQPVDYQGCEGLALNVLGDDQQRLAAAGNLLQNWQ